MSTRIRASAVRSTILVIAALFLLSAPRPAAAQRPAAPRMLPEKTLLYARVANTPELIEKFRQTSTGRMARDERLRPLLGQIWQVAVNAFKEAEAEVGVSLNDLIGIPQGEICFALVAPESGTPHAVLWIDCGDRVTTLLKLVERAEQAMLARNATRTVERVDDVEIITHEMPNRNRSNTVYFFKDQTLVLSSNIYLARQVLAQWTGQNRQDVVTLAENRKFTAIMNRSMGTKGEEPQVTWFIDPFELARRAGRGNTATQTTLAILTGLGIDGVKGIGGSVAFATEEFDSILHAHVLLDNPRKGVVNALALESGDVQPELWAPVDLESYMTLNWNVQKTYSEVIRLYDMFRGGDGSFKAQVFDRIAEEQDIHLEKDLIHAVTGRVTMITWMEKPARLNSQSTLIGIKLVDADATRDLLERSLARFSDTVTKKSYDGITYYETPIVRNQRRRNQAEEAEPTDPSLYRPLVGCVAVVDDYLLLSNGVKILEQAILAKRDPTRSLANELDYRIIASKIRRHLGDAEAGMVAFSRPEESMRQIYDLATSENVRSMLRTQSESNPLLKGLHGALNDNPLPPFSVLAQYLAPSGALLTTDETGFHYMAFSLRRDD